jgi:hypothetical protein
VSVQSITVSTAVVDEQPAGVVNVKVAFPAETAVITPELFIVATALLELDHVPPVDGVAVIVDPLQTELADKDTVGRGFTVTVTGADGALRHPLALVTRTV